MENEIGDPRMCAPRFTRHNSVPLSASKQRKTSRYPAKTTPVAVDIIPLTAHTKFSEPEWSTVSQRMSPVWASMAFMYAVAGWFGEYTVATLDKKLSPLTYLASSV